MSKLRIMQSWLQSESSAIVKIGIAKFRSEIASLKLKVAIIAIFLSETEILQ